MLSKLGQSSEPSSQGGLEAQKMSLTGTAAPRRWRAWKERAGVGSGSAMPRAQRDGEMEEALGGRGRVRTQQTPADSCPCASPHLQSGTSTSAGGELRQRCRQVENHVTVLCKDTMSLFREGVEAGRARPRTSAQTRTAGGEAQ